MNRSRDNWKSKKSQSRQSNAPSPNEPSWKQSRTRMPRKSRRRPWMKLTIPVFLLCGGVALAIWLFDPQPIIHTHFRDLNLLRDANTGAAASEYFDLMASPKFPSLPVRQRPIARATVSSADSIELGPSGEQPELHEADVVIINLQTQFIRDADGSLLALVRSSTPDLNPPSEYEQVSVLKKNLADFLGSRPDTNVLLVVDQPETQQGWRLGHVTTDFAEEFLQWPQDEPFQGRLVVLTACDAGQHSVPTFAGSGGRTAFGEAVMQGLSKAADPGGVEADGRLTAAEFCQFVIAETDRWVRQHRQASGQRVQVSPSLESLSKSNGGFVVLNELPAAPAQVTFRRPSDARSTLDPLWVQRETLGARQAWRWQPMSWQSATELLLRAQKSMLSGQDAAAQVLARRAATQLELMEQETRRTAATEADVNPARGLPLGWFQGMPSAARLREVWPDVEIPADDSSPAESVLQQNLDAYPFETLGITQSGEVRDEAISLRTQAENSAAQAMGLTNILRQTILKAEQQTLDLEDRLFVRQDGSGEMNVEKRNVRDQWDAIAEFCIQHQQAAASWQRVTADSESLARWAAVFRFAESEEWLGEWRSLLSNSIPSVRPTSDEFSTLDSRAGGLAETVATGAEGVAARMKSEVFVLLTANRLKGTLLFPTEPEGGFRTAELRLMTSQLIKWQQETETHRERLAELMSRLTTELVRNVDERASKVRRRQQVDATLLLTGLPAEDRMRLLDVILDLDKWLSENEPDPADTAAEQFADRQPVDEFLWLIQFLNLFTDVAPELAESRTLIQEVDRVASQLDTPGSVELAEVGKAVRGFRRRCRLLTADALASVSADTEQRLRNADRLSRGFAAFDVDRTTQSPARRLHAVWRTDYCLLQAERRVAGQWVRPDDRPPWNDNAWYVQQARRWLKLAENQGLTRSDGARSLPTFVSNAITEMTDQLDGSTRWTIHVSPVKSAVLDLSVENKDRQTLSCRIVRESTPPTGLAAVQFRTELEKSFVRQLKFPQNGMPLSLHSDEERTTAEIQRIGNPAGEGCEQVPYSVHTFFRGREWKREAVFLVNPCAAAEFRVTRVARPEETSVRVFGDDVRPIVFVLDWSKSMAEESHSWRHEAALNALRDLILSPGINEQGKAMLKVFGHRVAYNGNTGKTDRNGSYEKVFGPVPSGLEVNRDVETEVPLTGLSRTNRLPLLEYLDKLEDVNPFGLTPLAYAIKEAILRDLDGQAGIVVVITDGQATDVGGGKNHPDLREQLKDAHVSNPDIKVIIVALDFEDRNAERQALNDVFQNQMGFTVVDASNEAELIREINQGLRPPKFRVEQKTSHAADLGETVAHLDPGEKYNVVFDDFSTKDISLSRGDRVRFRVDWNQRRLVADRAGGRKWAKADVSPQSRAKDCPDTVRVIDASLRRDGGETLGEAVIDLMLDHSDTFRPVRQPVEIEFRLTSRKDYRAPAVQESFLAGFGAPGYRIVVPEWPRDQNVRIEAVWKMTRTVPDRVVEYATLESGSQLSADNWPDVFVSHRLRNGVLEIRLDPAEGATPDPEFGENAVQEIRIEVGSRGVFDGNDRFQPEEVPTTIRRTANGSVIYEFAGDYTPEQLAKLELAFTSRSERLKNSIRVPELEVVMQNYRD